MSAWKSSCLAGCVGVILRGCHSTWVPDCSSAILPAIMPANFPPIARLFWRCVDCSLLDASPFPLMAETPDGLMAMPPPWHSNKHMRDSNGRRDKPTPSATEAHRLTAPQRTKDASPGARTQQTQWNIDQPTPIIAPPPPLVKRAKD